MPRNDDWPKEYVKELCDIYNKRHGKGAAKGNPIMWAFSRLKKAGAAWDEVVLAWRLYIVKEAPEWQQPHMFAAKWRSWLEPTRSAVERQFDNVVGERRLFDAHQGRLAEGHAPDGRRLPERIPGRTHASRRVRKRTS